MTDRLATAEWRLDCLNSRMDALDGQNKLCNKALSARSDAMTKLSASEYRKLVNSVDYAITNYQGAGNTKNPDAHNREQANALSRLYDAVRKLEAAGDAPSSRLREEGAEILRMAKRYQM